MIEIPGYRILRQLGRGGMATVYLAIQQSVDREVALKIMNPALLADPNFGERFLREARIAAKLHHRHVVGVHDVGKHGDVHYIAMEQLGGGPILRKDGQPRDVVFALRVVRGDGESPRRQRRVVARSPAGRRMPMVAVPPRPAPRARLAGRKTPGAGAGNCSQLA